MTLVLPIDNYFSQFQDLWQKGGNLLINASPGSGKTTRIPRWLQQMTGKKVLVLEPRKLAAKWAARWVSQEMGSEVGREVGHAFRYETVVSSQTQILYLTEGTFLRRLLQDPTLKDVGTVVLDEFHERHLETDLSLALLEALQRSARPDLRLVIMSATMESDGIKEYLQASNTGAVSELLVVAPPHPLTIEFIPSSSHILSSSLEKRVLHCLGQAWAHPGDILIFLPGMGEIRRVEELLGELRPYACLLHGSLSQEEQQLALSPRERRKIILSTNISESSLTIPGVGVVIDSGQHRENHFSPWSGLSELKLKKISRASAVQRANRANRTGPGLCLRAYSKIDFESRPAFQSPEILRSDLLETALLTTKIEQQTGQALRWITPPPMASWEGARQVLTLIGAIKSGNKSEREVTEIGEGILKYPLPPRLGRILLEAQRSKMSRDNFERVVDELCRWADPVSPQRLRKSLRPRWTQEKEKEKDQRQEPALERIFLAGLPDHLARYRGPPHEDYICASGEALKLAPELRARGASGSDGLWMILEVNGRKEISKIMPVEEDWPYDLDPLPFSEKWEVSFDAGKGKINVQNVLAIGALKFEVNLVADPLRKVPPEIKEEIFRLLRREAERALQEMRDSPEFLRLHYLQFMNKGKIDIPALDENSILRDFIEAQDGLMIDGRELRHFYLRSWQDNLAPCLPKGDLESFLPLALEMIPSPSVKGKRTLPIHYLADAPPFLEAPIQDFYGLKRTPTIGRGTIPLTLKLLGPHGRALQVTSDLEGFWRKTYQGMLKELRRDYPKHHWPDDPGAAVPARIKRHLLAPSS